MKRFPIPSLVLALAAALTMTGCGGILGFFGGDDEATLSSISASPSAVTLTAGGESAEVVITGEYSDDSTDEITDAAWSTSDSSVATVSEGVITPVAAGTATITASKGGKTATVTVTVEEPVPLFADTGFDYYMDGDPVSGNESSVVGAFDSSTVTIGSSGAANVVFNGYPLWWSGGVGFAQKPTAATGYYDLSSVSTIAFQLRSADIAPEDLYILIQWYGQAAGSGGLSKVSVASLGVTDLSDWTTVTLDSAAIIGGVQPRFNNSGQQLTQVTWADGAAYVDTAFALAWGYAEINGGVVSGALSNGDSYEVRDVAFHDSSDMNVDIAAGVEFEIPVSLAASPDVAEDGVISLYNSSGTYIDAAVGDWSPNWGQGGSISDFAVVGETTVKLLNLVNYQGIAISDSGIDVSQRTTLHMSVWTNGGTGFKLYPISPGPQEYGIDVPVNTTGAWIDVEVDLSVASNVDLAHLFQLKFDTSFGSAATYYLDNIYFH